MTALFRSRRRGTTASVYPASEHVVADADDGVELAAVEPLEPHPERAIERPTPRARAPRGPAGTAAYRVRPITKPPTPSAGASPSAAPLQHPLLAPLP
jgi:hypothetical protein